MVPRPRGFRAASVREGEHAARWKSSLDASRKEDRMLRKAYARTAALLKGNFLLGEVVPVPLDARFGGLTNLRCVDLAGFRRLLFTVIGTEEGVHVLIVDVVSHPECDRLFRVRKK